MKGESRTVSRDLEVAAVGRRHEGRGAEPRLDVRRRSGFEEGGHDLPPAVVASVDERGHSVHVGAVHGRAPLEQPEHHAKVPLARGVEERRGQASGLGRCPNSSRTTNSV